MADERAEMAAAAVGSDPQKRAVAARKSRASDLFDVQSDIRLMQKQIKSLRQVVAASTGSGSNTSRMASAAGVIQQLTILERQLREAQTREAELNGKLTLTHKSAANKKFKM